MTDTVMPTGQIIPADVTAPKQPDLPAQSGSSIQAAATKLEQQNNVHAGAVKSLAGGSRKRRFRGGADTVQVKAVPNFVTANGVDPKASYADILRTAHAATAAGKFDGLGDATPMNVNGGGRRRYRKRSRKHNGGVKKRRSKRSTLLRSRRTRRRSRGIRASRS